MGSGLSKPLRWLVVNNSFIFVVLMYIGIYVNLYIWEIERQISDVAWFNLVMLASWSIAFYLGARLMMKYSLRLLTVLAAGFGGMAFLALTFLKLDNQMAWIAAVAAPVGAMWGCYVSAQNLSVSLVGEGEQFLRYFGIIGVLCQLISVSVPVLAAQVILWFDYIGSFVLMFPIFR